MERSALDGAVSAKTFQIKTDRRSMSRFEGRNVVAANGYPRLQGRVERTPSGCLVVFLKPDPSVDQFMFARIWKWVVNARASELHLLLMA